jgi:transglutaminase-like putative cysteine protease
MEDRTAGAISIAIDSRDPVTRDFAVSLIRPEHGGIFRTSQICDLWESVDSRWTYVDDPNGSDYFSPASRTIALGLKGDCDDFAIVIAAMIESVGGNARIIYATNGTSGHAYPEVYIGSTAEEFEKAAAYIRQRYGVTDVGCHVTRGRSGTQYWLNLDWWSRHPGGVFFFDDGVRIAYYPDGRWERVES